MRIPFVFIIPILFSQMAMAGGRPDWVDHFSPENGGTKYFVGRATSSSSDADAVFQATTNARKQAIGEFEVAIKFESQSYRSMDTLSATQSAQEISSQVRLAGFKQKDIYFEREDGKVNAWILFQYPQSEAAKEHERLEKLRAKGNGDIFKMADYGPGGHPKPASRGHLKTGHWPEVAFGPRKAA